MNVVFADTFYFFALLNSSDADHAKAVEFSHLVNSVVTTEWVLLELADGLATTPGRRQLAAIRQALVGDDAAEIVALDMGIHQSAIDLYVNRPDKDWSLTDCVSFVVMNDRGLTDALTGDRHFEQAGFRALLK